MKITRQSPFTGQTHTMDIDVTEAQMQEFASPNRRLIQQIFPNLSADEREFIKTGLMPEEWANEFPAED